MDAVTKEVPSCQSSALTHPVVAKYSSGDYATLEYR
jgi:hypothetical protein